MVLCKMNTLGICSVLCLVMFYVIDVCDAECDEYIVVLEESFCPNSKISYRIRPLKQPEINWDNVTYPCNSTANDLEKEKCLLEFDCLNTNLDCPRHIKQVHHETHYDIADPKTVKPIRIITEAPDVTTSNMATEKLSEAPDVTISNMPVTEKLSEAPDITTSNISVTEKLTEAPDITTSNISVTEKLTEAPDITTSNIPVTEKSTCMVYEEFKASMYDVNLIYINENGNQNSSNITNQIPRNETLYCHYAETVCIGEMNPENDTLSDEKNVTDNTHHEEPAVILELSINRDETSPVQPIFTGYFRESSNDSSTNYSGNFKYLKTISQTCPILKHDSCKQNKYQINIYIKANYVENNTLTKYPNCTKDLITSDNVFHVDCKETSFAEYNRHLEYTPPNPPPKQKIFTCQILTSKDQRNQVHFINCSSNTKIGHNKIEFGDSDITPVLGSKKITIDSILTNVEMNNTEISTAKEKINIDPENMVTIVVTENTNNCSHDISLNIDEGNIIDLDVNNKEKILQNNNIELLLSNCINENSQVINNKQPRPQAELTIILKSESLNALNLKQFNGTTTDKSVKQRILLRCDHPYHKPSKNATNDKTTLQCDSIDLELYNITGIEVLSNEKTENKIMQELLSWNCTILEINDTSKENKLYFENCSNNLKINNSTIKSENGKIYKTKPKDDNKMHKSENSSGKLQLNEDNLSQLKPKNMINILVTEKVNDCRNHSYFMIDEGKIVGLDVNKAEEKILQNNIVELEISSCIDVDSSIIKETKPDSKVELTIILNSESLNASNFNQFNGTAKDESDKQRILLRCDHPNLDLSSNATSDKTVLHCEPIDLVLNNITGVEMSTNVNQTSNTNRDKELKKKHLNMVEGIGNHTKVNVEIQKKSNQMVEINATINNKSLEDVVESTEVQKNISKTKESNQINKKTDENKEEQKISINQMFNRKKDIPNSLGHNSLALPTERETILIIALLSIICSCILMVIAWRLWPNKKREYNPAPTREPPDEETAF